MVYATRTLHEQRLGLLNERPRRSIRVNWLARNRSLAYRLFFQLQRLTDEERLIPIYQDVAYTTALSSGVTIHCPTAHRRFYAGVQVAIVQVGPEGTTNIQVGTIDTVGASSLTLEDALTGSYPAGSRVYPLIACQKSLANAGSVVTDRVYRVVADFVEVLGNSSVPASAADDTVPAGFATHEHPNGESYPIFRARPNWAFDVRAGAARIGTRRVIGGRWDQVDVQGDRASLVLDFTISALSRAEFWELLQFFDGRRGRLRPFWIANPLVLFDAVGIGTTQVVVTAPTGGAIEDAEDLLRFVAIRLVDGTTYVRLVEGGIEEGSEDGTWELNFMDEALPALDLEDVAAVSSGHLVRFATDALEEAWLTDEVAEAKVSVQEVHDEEEVEIEGIV